MHSRTIRCLSVWLLFVFVLILGTRDAGAQPPKVLFHGATAIDALTAPDDLMLARLQTLFGAPNVTYMAAPDSADDGSSANGFNALVISSTVASADVRGTATVSKYENSPVGILNMEAAVMDCGVGELCLASGGASNSLGDTIDILNPTHPLAAGLSGTVTVFNTNDPLFVMNASAAGTAFPPPDKAVAAVTSAPTRMAIWGVENGRPLAGHNPPSQPRYAAGRRVSSFIHQTNFAALSADGLKLFDAAAQWVAATPAAPPIPGDFNDDGKVDAADYVVWKQNEGANINLPGDTTADAIVGPAQYSLWQANFGNPPGSGAAQNAVAVPEPKAALLALLGTVGISRRIMRRARRCS
jgi:hypothetical protein